MRNEIKLANDILSTISNDPIERERYRVRLRLRRDWALELAAVRDEGKAEAKADVAKKLLKLGISIDTIIEGMGLKHKEI
jgi:Fe2+ transport system protein FeoA